jgi:hypothetical protein
LAEGIVPKCAHSKRGQAKCIIPQMGLGPRAPRAQVSLHPGKPGPELNPCPRCMGPGPNGTSQSGADPSGPWGKAAPGPKRVGDLYPVIQSLMITDEFVTDRQYPCRHEPP